MDESYGSPNVLAYMIDVLSFITKLIYSTILRSRSPDKSDRNLIKGQRHHKARVKDSRPPLLLRLTVLQLRLDPPLPYQVRQEAHRLDLRELMPEARPRPEREPREPFKRRRGARRGDLARLFFCLDRLRFGAFALRFGPAPGLEGFRVRERLCVVSCIAPVSREKQTDI